MEKYSKRWKDISKRNEDTISLRFGEIEEISEIGGKHKVESNTSVS